MIDSGKELAVWMALYVSGRSTSETCPSATINLHMSIISITDTYTAVGGPSLIQDVQDMISVFILDHYVEGLSVSANMSQSAYASLT